MQPPSARAPRRRCGRASAGTCRVEGLEPRRLLAFAAAGTERFVNNSFEDSQTNAAVAMEANGDFVVAWQSNLQDGSDFGVYARRFDAAGTPLADNFQVSQTTAGAQFAPAVAMDADGDFVVAWAGTGPGDLNGVFARRYNFLGVAQGGEFRVNTTTALGQFAPSVAMDDAGDFVVTWESRGQDSPEPSYGIYAQSYNAAGAAQGGEFRVNATGTDEQRRPDVAMDADGDFAIAWTSEGQDGSGEGVFAQRFSAAGAAQGGEFQVNVETDEDQSDVAVAMDDSGDFVVAWQSYREEEQEVYARRFDAAGAAQGGEFRVNATTAVLQWRPDVAMDADGDFLVAWEAVGPTQDGSGYGVYAQAFRADGTPAGREMRVNTSTDDDQTAPAVALGAKDVGVVAYTSAAVAFSGNNIFAQRYVGAPDPVGPVLPVNTTIPGGQGGRDQQDVAMDDAGDFVVTWSGTGVGDADGVFVRRFDAAGAGQGDEALVNQSTQGIQSFPVVAADADGDFVVAWASADQDGSQSGIYARRFNATGVPQGEEFLVNTTTAGSQAIPEVAMDDDGDFLIAWVGSGFGDTVGIFAQRFDAAGDPLGGEFRVNQFTDNTQRAPAAAMDADGDFVVAWESFAQDQGGSRGVYARRYNAAGAAQGDEFRVNTALAGDQGHPSVAMDDGGDFVIAYDGTTDGPGNNETGVYAKRYTSFGQVLNPGEFRVNTDTDGDQFDPSAAMDADGEFVVTWRSFSVLRAGMYGQRYDSVGNRKGGEFPVTPAPDGGGGAGGDGFEPIPAMDADGDFVVIWDAFNQGPDDVINVLAQRFEEPDKPEAVPPRVAAVFVDSSLWSEGFRQFLQDSAVGSSALGFRVDAGAAQLDELPWVNVDRFHVVFSENVFVDDAALSIRGVNVADYGPGSDALFYNPATFTARWSLAAPVAADKVLLDLDAGLVTDLSLAANALDGEWSNGDVGQSFPSGDGAAGGDFHFQLHVLPGDVNRNGGIVNALDVQQVRNRQFTSPQNPGIPPNTYSAFFDVNGSAGIINALDVQLVRIRQFSQLPGGTPTLRFPVPAGLRARGADAGREAGRVEDLLR